MAPYQSARPLLGIALKLASTIAFTAMATLLKLVSTRYPVGELVFYRSFFALIPVFVWVAWRDKQARAVIDVFKTERFWSHTGRCVVASVGMFLGFSALTLLPIADATAIGYAAPLMAVMFANVLLGEKVYIFRWAAVLVGLCGVLIMLTDFFGPDSRGIERSVLGAFVAVGAAIVGALASTYTRLLTRNELAATIVIYFSAYGAFYGFLTLPLGWFWPEAAWSTPTAHDMLLLFLAGIFGGVAQVLLTQCYRFGEAGTIAPFDYTSMIWVLLVSFFVFGTFPSTTILTGTVIVISAGLFVIFREHMLGIERARSKSAQTPTTPLS
jgi:drug/metabolite transporter (DMT)-like permease